MMIQSALKLVRLKCNVISFAMQALLSSQQTRDDYLELLEFTVFYLGVIGYSTTLGTSYDPWSVTHSPVDGQIV